jgi:ABC-type dipeptide/oligopeptide/nickel transport system ATPase subunit
MPIPEYERYEPSSHLKDSGKSTLNQTWVEHGVSIVNNAVKNNGLHRQQFENSNNSSKHSQKVQQEPINSLKNGRDILQEINDRIDADGGMDLSHFLDTQESWVTETGDFSDIQCEDEEIKLQSLEATGIVSYSLSED